MSDEQEQFAWLASKSLLLLVREHESHGLVSSGLGMEQHGGGGLEVANPGV